MSSRRKKNKRGDRGSVEEEERVIKKSNMAEKEEQETEPEEETNLAEIKALLMEIQNTVSTLLTENQSLKEELSELKASLIANKRTTDQLKVALTKAENANVTLTKELDCTRKKLREQAKEINDLENSQDELEQYTRKNSLEIVGVPETAYPSTEELVIRVGEILNVEIKPEDIEISHKLKRKYTNAVIVKFLSHKVKTKLYKQRTKLKNVKVSDLFPSFANATRDTGQRIFINENLTSYRRELFGKVNKKRKDNLIVSAWTMDGKIYVKTSPDGTPVRIYSEGDLEDL